MKDNPVMQNIIARESCRKFKPEKISREDIETIVTAGAYAPSAGGRQPWHFAVVTNPEIINFIAEDSEKVMKATKASASESERNRHKGNFTSMPTIAGNEGFAPLLIMIFEPKERTQDAASHLAAENMMLAAQSLGIYSIWLGAINANTVQKHIEDPEGSPLLKQLVPEDCHLVCTLGFGYPEPDGFRHPRLERRTDNVHYYE